MSVVVAPPAPTLADLLESLGDISPSRVRLRPPPGTATEADLLAVNEHQHTLCELVDGVLVEKAMSFAASMLAVYIAGLLNQFVRTRNLGIVSGPDGSLRLMSGLVRIPDVAFTSWDRMPGRRRPTQPIPSLAPDLAIEVLSPSNTRREMERKRGEYFSVGVTRVWEIDPDTRTARVYSTPDQFVELGEADTLDAAPVLPGFTLALRDLFAELDRQG